MPTPMKGQLVREVKAIGLKPLVVRMTPEGLYVKAKGRRTWLGPVSWGAIYSLAAKQEAAHAMKEKAARKTTRNLLREV